MMIPTNKKYMLANRRNCSPIAWIFCFAEGATTVRELTEYEQWQKATKIRSQGVTKVIHLPPEERTKPYTWM
jgi:hypothetical protein